MYASLLTYIKDKIIVIQNKLGLTDEALQCFDTIGFFTIQDKVNSLRESLKNADPESEANIKALILEYSEYSLVFKVLFSGLESSEFKNENKGVHLVSWLDRAAKKICQKSEINYLLDDSDIKNIKKEVNKTLNPMPDLRVIDLGATLFRGVEESFKEAACKKFKIKLSEIFNSKYDTSNPAIEAVIVMLFNECTAPAPAPGAPAPPPKVASAPAPAPAPDPAPDPKTKTTPKKKSGSLVDALASIWNMTVPEVIQQFEDAHVGGIADLGDSEAKNLISSVPNYEQFQQRLANTIRSSFGNSFSVFRSMSQSELDNWKNGEDMGALSVTFSKSVADGFTNLAAVKDKNRVVVRIFITPDMVIMRGSENEQELVVDGNQISFSDIKVIGLTPAPAPAQAPKKGKTASSDRQEYIPSKNENISYWLKDIGRRTYIG